MNDTLYDMVTEVSNEMAVDSGPYSSSLVDNEAIIGFVNRGQRELTREILKIKEDYFLTYHDIPIEANIDVYDLPDGIFVNKIRKIAYQYGGFFTNLKRLSFNDYVGGLGEAVSSASVPWGYFLMEVPTDGKAKIHLIPQKADFSSTTTSFRVFYIRMVRPMVKGPDFPDIPESSDYLVAYAKWQTAMVDPTRATETYEVARNEALKNVIESFLDRVPQEGGDPIEIPSNILEMSYNPAEDI